MHQNCSYSYNIPVTIAQAYKRGLVSPKYMFITYGWYGERWWGEGAISRDYNCTSEDLAAVALYGVAAVLAEFPDEPDAIAEPNIVSCGSVLSLHQAVGNTV